MSKRGGSNRAEQVIAAQLTARLADLPAGGSFAGRKITVSPAPGAPPPDPGGAPRPKFTSWAAYLDATPGRVIREWCARKAKVADRERLMSGRPAVRLVVTDVLDRLVAARGRCCHCGSLAVEGRPSGPGPARAAGSARSATSSAGSTAATTTG